MRLEVNAPNLGSGILGDQGLDLFDIGTNDSADLLTLLEEQDSRHSRDFILSRDIGNSINIDLVKVILVVLLGQFLDNGSNGLARVAPGGMEVDDDQAVLSNSFLELFQRGDFSNHFIMSLMKVSRLIK